MISMGISLGQYFEDKWSFKMQLNNSLFYFGKCYIDKTVCPKTSNVDFLTRSPPKPRLKTFLIIKYN